MIQKYYIYGDGLLAMVTSANALYCYHYDGTGHTVALTDASAAVVNKYAYTPFGKITNQVEAVAQPFKYAGKFGVMAEPNGNYYMRARYYDPSVGRFISEDPIGFGGGDVNLMAYVSNNPVMGVDPSGLWVAQAIGGVAGAGYGMYAAHENGTSMLQGMVVGGLTGVLSTIPIPGLSGAVSGLLMGSLSGGLGNLAGQATSSQDFQWDSLGYSMVAGGAGGALGGGLAGARLTQTVKGPLLDSVSSKSIFTPFGQDVVSASVGGMAAGALDVATHK